MIEGLEIEGDSNDLQAKHVLRSVAQNDAGWDGGAGERNDDGDSEASQGCEKMGNAASGELGPHKFRGEINDDTFE